jgi:exopolysaccharide biosynthesis polyprenyl glycosylphosphotransferase
MNQNRVRLLRWLLAVSDACVIVSAFVVASWLRFGTQWWSRWEVVIPEITIVAPLAIAAAIAVFWFHGLYELGTCWSLRRELRVLAVAGVTFVTLTMAALFLFKLEVVSRLFLAAFFPLVALGMTSARATVRWGFRWANRRGRGLRHLLLVGSGPLAEQYLYEGLAEAEVGVRLVGYVGEGSTDLHLPRFGDVRDLPRVLSRHVIDEVIIGLPDTAGEDIDFAIRAAQEQGIAARIPLHADRHTLVGARLEVVGRTPTLAVSSHADRSYAMVVKRIIDVAGATALLVCTLPIMLAAAVAIALTDGRPVLFRQRRTGLHGRDFWAYKLRTMERDAEARLPELLPMNERSGPVFKLAADPRVIRVGRVLRRASVDELPQLWNVLRGEMSLVGPRPATLDEVERYDSRHRRRLSVKPGLTGLWQVSARNDPEFEHWVALDLAYIDTWSLQGDLKLLARTPLALLRESGT